jgi:hypothetical protein
MLHSRIYNIVVDIKYLIYDISVYTLVIPVMNISR